MFYGKVNKEQVLLERFISLPYSLITKGVGKENGKEMFMSGNGSKPSRLHVRLATVPKKYYRCASTDRQPGA